MRKHISSLAAALICLLIAGPGFSQDLKVLINHVGYEPDAAKRAVILGHDGDDVSTFRIDDDQTGAQVLAGQAVRAGHVDQWKDWVFWTIDFSMVTQQGDYTIECDTNHGVIRSCPFLIQPDLLERNTLSNVIYYFKDQRSSGLLDKADRNVKFENSTATADLHGGWFDATGDYGKHLSGLSFATYFCPQLIQLADWTMFQDYRQLTRRDTAPQKYFRQYRRRLLDEAMFGADFLVRDKNPNGSFYRSIDAPGGEKRPEDRLIGIEKNGFAIKTLKTKNSMATAQIEPIATPYPYEVGLRNGGGVAIAALAEASTFGVSGDFSNARYLQTARDAFDFLQKHNLQFTNDGKENIIDDYCGLLAATELFKATHEPAYKSAADLRAANLMGRLVTSGPYINYWRAGDTDRPFFHPTDAGMPVVSLLNYYEIADASVQPQILQTVRKSLEFEMRTTDEVINPFGYARQLVQSPGVGRRTAFFFPHDTETAPWWQGENARLGSLAAAARLAARCFNDDPTFQKRLRTYAENQLNWILGLNPYDVCMLHGTGRNNVAYMFFDSYEYTNTPGGVCNGITAGYSNFDDIDFNLGYAVTGKDEDWRWGEQWLPHAAWYLYAVCIGD